MSEDGVSGSTMVKLLGGVAFVCYLYPPMLGFVIGLGGMLLLNYILYLFFLDFNRTFRK